MATSKRSTRFRTCLYKTIFSQVLGRFVRVYQVDEDEACDVLSHFDLNGYSLLDYMGLVAELFAEDKPQADAPEVVKKDWLAEMYGAIMEFNPYLAPGLLETTELAQPKRRARSRRKSLPDPERLYRAIKHELDTTIIGQRVAVERVLYHMARGLLRKGDDSRPIANLIFAGLSGVGKTEVARAIARGMESEGQSVTGSKDDGHGSIESRLIRIDCGEYGASHQAARLLGSPPGYVGHEHPSYLESRIRPDKIQVLLFDEIEKAHSSLLALLLGVLEDGLLTTGSNTTISLRNTIIIMTSNLGTRELSGTPPGFNASFTTGDARRRIEKELPVEFLNRINDVVVFNALGEEELLRIAELEMQKLQRSTDHLVRLQWNDATLQRLVKDSPRHLGGRPLRRKVEDLQAEISLRILQGEIKKGSTQTF